MVKEYWVNVYQDGSYGMIWYSQNEADKRSAFHLAYRIHVKMKDKIGLSRNYYWTFDEWKFFNGSQWTPEQMKEPKPIGRQIPVKPQYINKSSNWWD